MKSQPARLSRILFLVGSILLTACAAAGRQVPIRYAGATPCTSGAGSCNVLSGYSGNFVQQGLSGATISGGGSSGNPNQVEANFGTVGGGQGNVAGEGSTVSGGYYNRAVHFRATIGGGSENLASAQEATVAGGLKNTASQRFATVGGGAANVASDLNATVSGGSGNIAQYQFSTVGGGTQNLASNIASAVAGGDHNQAQGPYSSVVGGLNNNAGGYMTAVLGGAGNTAMGNYAVAAGGFSNSAAGDYSVAVGHRAIVQPEHSGAFLFADSSLPAFTSTAANEFAVRATGGVRFVSGIDETGASQAGVRLSPGSGSWESLSDRSTKAGFALVNGLVILEKLNAIPISAWHYRSQRPSIRHIGPMAQDFYRAFGVGQDDRYISNVDEEGVALAAIQELYRLVQRSSNLSQAQEIDSLEHRLALSNTLSAASLIIAIGALWRRAPRLPSRQPTASRRRSA